MEQLFVFEDDEDKINDPSLVFDKIKTINCDYDQENLIVIYLNTRNKIIKSEILFKGGLDKCLVDQRTLFRKALLNNSRSVIIAHNHPSGNLKPSNDDIKVYKDLKKIGEMLDLQLLDSIIFNKTSYYSIRGGC